MDNKRINKFIIISVILFVILALPTFYIYEQAIRKDVFETAKSELDRELDSKIAILKERFDEGITTIQFLDTTPPIQSIANATFINNSNDKDSTTPVEEFKSRLAAIFVGLITTDENLFQLRYIQFDEGGHEVVRVDRLNNGIILRRENNQLQKKGHREYVIKTSQLNEAALYISPINYNREEGDIEKPLTPTYRVAKAVFNQNKKAVGALVANFYAQGLFDSFKGDLLTGNNVYLINNNNDFLYHPEPQYTLSFEVGRPYKWSDGFVVAQDMTKSDIIPFYKTYERYFLKRQFSLYDDIDMQPLSLALSVESDALLNKVSQKRIRFLTILALFFTGLLLVIFYFQREIDRKLKYQSLKDKHNKIIEHSLDAIFIINDSGEISEANNTAIKNFSEKLNTIDNTLFISLFSIDKADMSCLFTTIKEGTKSAFELSYTDSHDEVTYYSATLSRVYDAYNNNYQVAAILRDITSLKDSQTNLTLLNNNLEQTVLTRTIELENAMQEAIEANKIKSEFIANISHEIRTPMNGVLGMLEMLKGDRLTEQQRLYLHLATDSAYSLMKLINNILDFSKIEALRLKLDNHPFDIVTVTEDIINSLALSGQRKGLEVFLDTEHVTQRMLVGDSYRLKQILVNLLNNAFKFTQVGEVTLSVSSNETGNQKVEVVLTVQDTGIGIAKEAIDTLFEVFTQEDSSTTRHFGGTGLGLSICKKLTNMMGGDVSVSSKKGAGSIFTATIECSLAETPRQNTPIKLDKNISVAVLVSKDSVFNNVKTLLRASCQVENVSRLDFSKPYKQLDTDLLITEVNYPHLDYLSKDYENNDAHYILILSDLTMAKKSEELAFLKKHVLNKPLSQDIFSLKIASLFAAPDEQLAVITDNSFLEFSPNLTDFHILLVDDNPINIEVAKAILKSTHAKVTTASDGLEALNVLKNKKTPAIDLILMDCQMPNLNGYDTTRKIRYAKAGEDYACVPIIAMTASVMEGDRERCLAVGMNDYITKPVNPKTLKQRLQAWLKVA